VRQEALALSEPSREFIHDLSAGFRLITKNGVHQGEHISPSDQLRLGLTHESAEIFEEREPKHDRKSPQLTRGELKFLLIGGDEYRCEVGVHRSVGVNNKLKRETVDPWKSMKLSTLEYRKSFVEAPWEIFFDRRDVSLNDVVVIEHPLGASRESLSVVRGFCETLVDPFQHFPVVLITLKEADGASAAKGPTVRFSELEGEFGKSLSAEDLSSPGRFGLLRGGGQSSLRDES
jgi:hypothetical protein